MNTTKNKNNRKSIFKAMAFCMLTTVLLFTLSSCENELDITQSYPFTVEIMPVPNKISIGETVEIRCELLAEGKTENTLYTIRYFQFEGEGTLKMENDTIFLPNDRYLLENERFRLYYTSNCDEAQNFIVVVEDNFGNSHDLEFDFNNENKEEEDTKVVSVTINPMPLEQ